MCSELILVSSSRAVSVVVGANKARSQEEYPMTPALDVTSSCGHLSLK